MAEDERVGFEVEKSPEDEIIDRVKETALREKVDAEEAAELARKHLAIADNSFKLTEKRRDDLLSGGLGIDQEAMVATTLDHLKTQRRVSLEIVRNLLYGGREFVQRSSTSSSDWQVPSQLVNSLPYSEELRVRY